eukprot:TRINITY_DN93546_c0_g1_i1.p1 TRINITY_DN93546_c0_g1~~TRINITY_DN93546_c0_g1_i1.p1  ORF type:complete len:465 (-),score=112.61 TRINITY_DN93546_c0_g1_i1:91-1485(-)
MAPAAAASPKKAADTSVNKWVVKGNAAQELFGASKIEKPTSPGTSPKQQEKSKAWYEDDTPAPLAAAAEKPSKVSLEKKSASDKDKEPEVYSIAFLLQFNPRCRTPSSSSTRSPASSPRNGNASASDEDSSPAPKAWGNGNLFTASEQELADRGFHFVRRRTYSDASDGGSSGYPGRRRFDSDGSTFSRQRSHSMNEEADAGALAFGRRRANSEGSAELENGKNRKVSEAFSEASTAATEAASAPLQETDSTTVLLQNIPKKYSRTGLCERLAMHGFGYDIDFLYLLMGSTKAENAGYAYINIKTKAACRDFFEIFDGISVGESLPDHESDEKLTCKVTIPPCQGRDAWMRKLCTNFNISTWSRQGEPWEPLFLDEDFKRMPLQLGQMLRNSEQRGRSPSVGVSQAGDGMMLKDIAQQLEQRSSSSPPSPGGTVQLKDLMAKLEQPSLRADAPVFVPIRPPPEL